MTGLGDHRRWLGPEIQSYSSHNFPFHIRVPDAIFATVTDDQRVLVEKGNAVPIQETPDLGLAAGPVRWLVESEAVFEPRGTVVQPAFTPRASLATFSAAFASRFSVRSMI